jgi:hypothetical protein
MSRDFLGPREQGLENEFFHRVDQKLWDELRQKRDADRQLEALRAGTGIADETVLRELLELGIGEDSLLALGVYPLVRVAWADGSIDPREREAVLKAADQAGCRPDTPAAHLLESWMDRPPEERVHRAWREYVHAVCGACSPEARAAMKQDVLSRARTVAEAAGGFLGFNKVSASEEAVLSELAREFDAVE